jgi:hypothetical protein
MSSFRVVKFAGVSAFSILLLFTILLGLYTNRESDGGISFVEVDAPPSNLNTNAVSIPAATMSASFSPVQAVFTVYRERKGLFFGVAGLVVLVLVGIITVGVVYGTHTPLSSEPTPTNTPTGSSDTKAATSTGGTSSSSKWIWISVSIGFVVLVAVGGIGATVYFYSKSNGVTNVKNDGDGAGVKSYSEPSTIVGDKPQQLGIVHFSPSSSPDSSAVDALDEAYHVLPPIEDILSKLGVQSVEQLEITSLFIAEVEALSGPELIQLHRAICDAFYSKFGTKFKIDQSQPPPTYINSIYIRNISLQCLSQSDAKTRSNVYSLFIAIVQHESYHQNHTRYFYLFPTFAGKRGMVRDLFTRHYITATHAAIKMEEFIAISCLGVSGHFIE